MATTQGSTLYGGSVSSATIYEIDKGLGLEWAAHIKTEVLVDGKPRQLTRAEHDGNPLTENVANPTAASFGSSPDVVIDGRQLSVVPVMAQGQWRVTDWKETFPEYQPSGLNIDLKMNPVIQKVVFSRVIEAAHTQINNLHSVGDDTLVDPDPLRFYNGFYTEIIADADATEVGTPAALTSSNIGAKVYELRNALPPRLMAKPNLKFFGSWYAYKLWDMYRRTSQTQVPDSDIKANDKLIQAWGSTIQFVPISGLPDNFIFATLADKSDRSNLVQGLWMENDLEALKLFRFSEADQDWNILMRMDLGVQYKTGKDIFYIDFVAP